MSKPVSMQEFEDKAQWWENRKWPPKEILLRNHMTVWNFFGPKEFVRYQLSPDQYSQWIVVNDPPTTASSRSYQGVIK